MNSHMKEFTSFLLATMILMSSLHITKAKMDDATSRISEADRSIQQAFEAVLEAESAGGNVSSLLTELNKAGAFLAQAENLYKNGNFSGAISLADKSASIAEEVKNDGLGLQSRASVESKSVLWHTIASSLLAASTFLIVLGIVWIFFKHSYVHKILKTKPEVVSHAET